MALTKFVDAPKFEDYKEKYKEHFIMERRNGIIMCRMHTQGKSVAWSVEIHRAIHQALHDVGADPENEVMILTGTGEYWIAHLAEAQKETAIDESEAKSKQWATYNYMYTDGTKIQDNLIYDLEIPTIGAINGPGFHSEMALMCDLTICSDDAVLIDIHYRAGLVPGDGVHCALQELLGPKRANYIMLMGDPITAKKALDWGLVNEVVPKKKIYDRAWEMGQQLMKANRIQRRLSTQIVRKPWKRRLAEDLHGGFAHEMFAYNVEDAVHDPKLGKALFEEAGVKIKDWKDL